MEAIYQLTYISKVELNVKCTHIHTKTHMVYIYTGGQKFGILTLISLSLKNK